MSETELPYFHPRRQVRKNVNTLVRSERYDFEEADRSGVEAERIGPDGFLYRTDGSSAGLNGDIQSVDDGTVENAAAFLDGEFEDEQMMWAYGLDNEDQSYGVVAAYRETETETFTETDERVRPPSAIVHVFEAAEDSGQIDIYVERQDEQENMTPQ